MRTLLRSGEQSGDNCGSNRYCTSIDDERGVPTSIKVKWRFSVCLIANPFSSLHRRGIDYIIPVAEDTVIPEIVTMRAHSEQATGAVNVHARSQKGSQNLPNNYNRIMFYYLPG